MENSKSILLLGGSRHQIPAITAAKKLGFRTVLCDYLPDNPGQYEADKYYCESTTDMTKMLEIAKEEKVSAVLAFGTDVAAITAAYVSEQLGLETNPLDSVEILSTKNLFRAHLMEHDFACPQFFEFTKDKKATDLTDSLDKLLFPIVIKPTDASGSKGVSIINENNLSSINNAILGATKYSRNGVLIAEEYIRSSFPRVIGGDIFVVNGSVTFWGLMSCFRDAKLGGLVPCGERFPSGLNIEQINIIKKEIQRLIDTLSIKFGEFNVEIIMGENDVPYFLELAARAGGNMIPDQLTDISGIDLIKANVMFSSGDYQEMNFDGTLENSYYCTYMIHADEPGIYSDLIVDDSIKESIYRQVNYREIGDQIDSFENSGSALGVLFLKFKTLDALEAFTTNPSAYIHVITQ